MWVRNNQNIRSCDWSAVDPIWRDPKKSGNVARTFSSSHSLGWFENRGSCEVYLAILKRPPMSGIGKDASAVVKDFCYDKKCCQLRASLHVQSHTSFIQLILSCVELNKNLIIIFCISFLLV